MKELVLAHLRTITVNIIGGCVILCKRMETFILNNGYGKMHALQVKKMLEIHIKMAMQLI